MALVRVGDSIFDRKEDTNLKVTDFYDGFFGEEGNWRPMVDGMVFDTISAKAVAWSERAFSYEEVVAALKSMIGDKAPGQDETQPNKFCNLKFYF